ncbi:hypothetical protein D9M69_574480 [compost metagenome]
MDQQRSCLAHAECQQVFASGLAGLLLEQRLQLTDAEEGHGSQFGQRGRCAEILFQGFHDPCNSGVHRRQEGLLAHELHKPFAHTPLQNGAYTLFKLLLDEETKCLHRFRHPDKGILQGLHAGWQLIQVGNKETGAFARGETVLVSCERDNALSGCGSPLVSTRMNIDGSHQR